MHVIRRDAMYDSQEVFVSYTHFLHSVSRLFLIYKIKICLFCFVFSLTFQRSVAILNSTIDADTPKLTGSALHPIIQR